MYRISKVLISIDLTCNKICKQDMLGHQDLGKSTKGHSRSKVGGVGARKQASNTSLSSESLWSDILEFAKVKYQVT